MADNPQTEASRLILREETRHWDMEPLAVASGDEALALFGGEHPVFDLAILDMHMPEMDGLEATRRIRAVQGLNVRPHIVAMTAAAMNEDREACIAAGMDAFLSKPVRVSELTTVLQQAADALSAREAEV